MIWRWGGAVTACEAAGLDLGNILFLGVDASANGCQAISDGRMDFTVYQPTSEQIVAAGQSIGDIEYATEDGKFISIKAKLLGIILPVVIVIVIVLVSLSYHVSKKVIQSNAEEL